MKVVIIKPPLTIVQLLSREGKDWLFCYDEVKWGYPHAKDNLIRPFEHNGKMYSPWAEWEWEDFEKEFDNN